MIHASGNFFDMVFPAVDFVMLRMVLFCITFVIGNRQGFVLAFSISCNLNYGLILNSEQEIDIYLIFLILAAKVLHYEMANVDECRRWVKVIF